MATQTKTQAIRRGAFNDGIALTQQVAAGIRYGEVVVDPGNLNAGAEIEVQVALPAGEAPKGNELVFVQPPADGSLEAGLVPLGARISGADTLRIKLRNVSAGAIDGAAKTWTYLVIDIPNRTTL